MSRILGRLVDASGKPVGEGRVVARHEPSGREIALPVRADGRFESEDLPAGRWSVEMSAAGARPVVDVIELKRGDVPPVRDYVVEPHRIAPRGPRFRSVALERLTRLPAAARAALERRGVRGADDLVWAELKGVGAPELAAQLGIGVADAKLLLEEARAQVPAEQRDRMLDEALRVRPIGALDDTDARVRRQFPDMPGRPDLIDWNSVLEWIKALRAAKSVDHRPQMSPVVDQGGRGTCTAFAATALREYFENVRAGRGVATQLSEEFNYWVSRRTSNVGGDGWSTSGAAQNYVTVGGCSETTWPYDGKVVWTNIAHVPAPTAAIADAGLYRMDAAESLTGGDVEALKDCLRAGKVAATSVLVFWAAWNGSTGVLTMPATGDTAAGGHALCVVGFYDDASAPGGGYFIFKNSWSRSWAWNSPLGAEYRGYGVMPYEYYKTYSGDAITFRDATARSPVGWRAEYFLNTDLGGKPALVQMVSAVDFDWGAGGPLPSPLPSDNFSARWSRVQRLEGGFYRFKVVADDGVRLFVDDRLLVNDWRVAAARTIEAELRLTPGDHVLRMEYFERTGAAVAKLSYAPIRWRTEYYTNGAFSGVPPITRTESEPDLEWRHVAPYGLGWNFAIRSAATLTFAAGTYVFRARSTGGVRIKVGTVTVLDAWTSTGGVVTGAPVTLPAGAQEVKIEFQNRSTADRAALRVDFAEDAWRTEIHANRDLSDLPAVRRTDADINFSWGRAAPATGVAADQYSARFTRTLLLPAGNYTVRATTDDGVRVMIDGRRVVDAWQDKSALTALADVYLTDGGHDVEVEYYENGGDASCNVVIGRSGWIGEYYANRDLQGAAVIRNDDVIDFDWVSEGPGVAGLGADNFSVRWWRNMHLAPGRYRCIVRSDEGVRLFVDGALLIDRWLKTSATAMQCEFDTIGGESRIVLEYVDRGGVAGVRFDIEPVGWLGEYFANASLEGLPAFYRVDPELSFDWSASPPAPRMDRDNFSVRWTRSLQLPVGRYRITTTVDDGIRVYLDGRLVIDRWTSVPAPLVDATVVDLVSRPYDVRVEYVDRASTAVCRVAFERVS